MNKIHYSTEALDDLLGIQNYISKDLENSAAAKHTLEVITKSIRTLGTFSEVGRAVASIVGFETKHRFLVSGNYLVFYYTTEKDVHIVRVLYGRRDYIKILFGEHITTK